MSTAESKRPIKARIEDELRLCHAIDNGNFNPPYHYHDIYEVYFCRTDRMRYLVGNRIYEIRDGDLLVFNALDVHRSLPPVGEKYERYMILFQPEFIEPWNIEGPDLLECFRTREPGFVHYRRLSQENQSRFMDLFHQGDRVQGPAGYGAVTRRRIFLVELLLFLNEVFREEPSGLPRHGGLDRARRILSYIDKHIAEELLLDTVAREFGTTPNGLNHILKTQVSFTVRQYIIQRRIQLARVCLKQGRSVSETAADVGFGNLSHFIRTFKAHTGISPGVFGKNSSGC